MEKIHVAPLSSSSIPALFAVPNTDKTTPGNANSMRLCKRIIFIKNGLSYSNYVPVTQAEADSKNMFGIERVVNVLDEKHRFKRHMVIKNWLHHVKPAKGAITALQTPMKKPTPAGPVAVSFVQIPISKSQVVTPKQETSEQPIKNVQPIAPQSLPPIVLVPVSKVGNKLYPASMLATMSKDSKISGKNVTVQTKKHVAMVLPVQHHQKGNASNTSDIKITSVFSLSGKIDRESFSKKKADQSTVVCTQLNASKQNVSNSAQTLNVSLSLGRTSSNVRTIEASKVSASTSSSIKEPIPSVMYLVRSHDGKPCLVTSKQPDLKEEAVAKIVDRFNANTKKKEPIKDTKTRKYGTKFVYGKNHTVRRSERKKTAKRPYSPSQSFPNSHDSKTVTKQRNDINSPVTETASIQMLKGVKRALEENKLVRRNRVLKISLSKILSVPQEHIVKKPKKEIECNNESKLFHTRSLSETSEVSVSTLKEEAVVKEEPLDDSDDNDNIGYLTSFMKEQQLIMEASMNHSRMMDFPLVMIKKEPVSDNEDTPDQEPVPSKLIKEEPLSDEDDRCSKRNSFSQFLVDPQCMDANNHTEAPFQKIIAEQEPIAVRSSRADRVKQLKERIKEKQNALAAFRKRPRISLIDDV